MFGHCCFKELNFDSPLTLSPPLGRSPDTGTPLDPGRLVSPDSPLTTPGCCPPVTDRSAPFCSPALCGKCSS